MPIVMFTHFLKIGRLKRFIRSLFFVNFIDFWRETTSLLFFDQFD